MPLNKLIFFLSFPGFACNLNIDNKHQDLQRRNTVIAEIRWVNEDEIPSGEGTTAIVGGMFIDVVSGEMVENAAVIIKGNRISQAGRADTVKIPEEAEVINAIGLTILPGLIDAHFHLDGLAELPAAFLKNGITSVRDPGAWIEAYDGIRKSGTRIPRLFLTGPHFDMPPPAYPQNSFIVLDPYEARRGVHFFVNQGASAIKVYFRCSMGIIKSICEAANEMGIPVTAHLEITDAREAIQAGLDGIEHITSFGTALVALDEAEKYRQAILSDNDARRMGRYKMWASIDIHNEGSDALIQLLVRHKTFVCPTLGAFEYQPENGIVDSIKLAGFNNMVLFTGKASQAGVAIVVGSHSWVEYAGFGWAYHREMELLSESGMTNLEILKAATIENARFFRVEDRLGSIEPGKQADLILVEGNPLEDIGAMRNVKKVMLNGNWIIN